MRMEACVNMTIRTLKSELQCTSLKANTSSLIELVIIMGTLLLSMSVGLSGNAAFLFLADNALVFGRVTLSFFRFVDKCGRRNFSFHRSVYFSLIRESR